MFMCFLNQLIKQPLKTTLRRDTVRGNALNRPKQPIHEMGESFYQKSEYYLISNKYNELNGNSCTI